MAKKKLRKPPRPKLRTWFPKRGPTWLKLEPAGLALVGGLFFATCAMVFYLVRQLTGAVIGIDEIVVRVALTFFLGYTGAGFFVWYLLHLAEQELDRGKVSSAPEHLTGQTSGPDAGTAQDSDAPAEPVETQEFQETEEPS